ncbi:EboA domain-containing protein [Actinomadura rugatobispora]|uniref:EboA domain-containing protein n=1 Tax=Actinomadura rugatobispora TaxID=1994 RepID=A0ABW1A6X5_9ACTN|nr:EboA domain-containing protein [Actinomadura rugatobispora]
MTREVLRARLERALRPALSPEAAAWLGRAREKIAGDPGAAAVLLPAAGRRCGRGPLPDPPGWTADDAARVAMLLELPCTGDVLAARLADLYRHGDAQERRGVLRSLDALGAEAGDAALPLLHDALRSNDSRLVAAALGPYAAARLPGPAWRQAVLKCAFTGVPLAVVAGLGERADAELTRMMSDYARERTAAGRDVPPDVARFLEAR